MKSRFFFFNLILGLAALFAVVGGLTGCSTSSTPTTPAGTTSPPTSATIRPTSSVASLTVNVANNTKLGDYLVDGNGMTLYYFAKDSVGKSTATGTVLANWPLFNPSNFIVPSALSATDFSTITRDDGAKVATYKGWPLYYYINDKVSGDTKGQGIGGVWFVVNPANFPPTTTPTPTSTPTVSTTPSATPAPSATPYSINIQGFAFSPQTLTVAKGTTVTWTNNDSTTHTVTSDTGVWDSGNLANGKTFSYTFSQTGTFPYHCNIHPSMTAKVIVQ